MGRTFLLVAVALAATQARSADLDGVFVGTLDHPAIQYATRPPNNLVTDLNRDIQDGKVQLKFEGVSGYLRSALDALRVPVESQMAVFSKTSLQQRIISPRNPRTIFFNDSVSVAWVRGEPFVEVAAQDSQSGVVFYTLDQKTTDTSQFVRRDNCLTCHESRSSLGVPGMLLRSVLTAPSGVLRRDLGDSLTDHRSPLAERWGGWYVTGKTGPSRHMGNLMVSSQEEADSAATRDAILLPALNEKFESDSYLSPYSDIVALLVFNHQMHMTNLITRIGWETRAALHDASGVLPEDATRKVGAAANELVDYLLFIDEAALSGKVEGASGFAAKFAALGPRDRQGRSLRQLDLQKRLLLYPCSYMIYTAAFDALPIQARDAIYQRMWQVLSGKETSGRYTRLTLTDRKAIVEILRDTKADLPSYFRDR